MAQSHREATPLLELGDQDSPRFDDLARLRMAAFEVDCCKLRFRGSCAWPSRGVHGRVRLS